MPEELCKTQKIFLKVKLSFTSKDIENIIYILLGNELFSCLHHRYVLDSPHTLIL